ncbi:MAG: hypothetical protein U0931_13535 [Vulcanimicrobiota bacterium]
MSTSSVTSKPSGSSSVKSAPKSGSAKSTKKVSSQKPASSSKPATAAKGPKESSSISGDARKAEKPNAMAQGITNNWKAQGLETSEGNKLGKYTKGGEGTIEKELLKKGFSLKDIYTKDKQGRTLADQVAQTNGIKNQKKIADGTELKLPQRPGAQGVSSGDVKPGEKKSIETVNGDNRAQQSIAKGPDGALKVDQSTAAGNNRVDVETKAAPGATSTGSTARVGDEVVNNNLTQSPDNKAMTETQQRTNKGDVQTTVRDVDGVANSTAQRKGDELLIQNPDGQKGSVDTSIKLGPQSLSEKAGQLGDRLGSYVAPNFFKPQQITAPEGSVGGLRQVDGVQRPDGSASYNLRQNGGQTQKVEQTERGTLQSLGKKWSDTLDGIGNSISSGLKNLFGGGGGPDAGIPAGEIFSPSGTII